MADNPGASVYWLAKMAEVDYKTAKRYAEMEERPEVRKGKQSALKPGFSIVKSVYYREKEILEGIMALYLKKGRFDADMTYSQGGFPQAYAAHKRQTAACTAIPRLLSLFHEREIESLIAAQLAEAVL